MMHCEHFKIHTITWQYWRPSLLTQIVDPEQCFSECDLHPTSSLRCAPSKSLDWFDVLYISLKRLKSQRKKCSCTFALFSALKMLSLMPTSYNVSETIEEWGVPVGKLSSHKHFIGSSLCLYFSILWFWPLSITGNLSGLIIFKVKIALLHSQSFLLSLCRHVKLLL